MTKKAAMKAVDQAMLRFLKRYLTEMQQLALKYSEAGDEDKLHETLARMRDSIDTLIRRPNAYTS